MSTALLSMTASFLAFALTACGGGGGSSDDSSPLEFTAEVEPNDTPARAGTMTLSSPCGGDVHEFGDADWWKIALTADDIVQFEVFAARRDQATWSDARNTLRIAVFDNDGATELLAQNPGGAAASTWYWGDHDVDIPRFVVPATGDYYVLVHGARSGETGGDYALVASVVDIENLQNEAEAIAASGANDTPGTAETITPGTVVGFHVDDELDYYAFTITEATVVDFEIIANRAGVWHHDDYIDPVVRLFAPDGTTLIREIDDAYGFDSAIAHWLTTPGTYFLQVDEYEDGDGGSGSGDGLYFLRFSAQSVAAPTMEVEANGAFTSAQACAFGEIVESTTSAGDDDYFSIAATAGDAIYVQLFDENNRAGATSAIGVSLLDTDGVTPIEFEGPGVLAIRRALVRADGTYFVHCESSDGDSSAYALKISRARASGFEAEPNDDSAGAGAFDDSDHAAGVIATDGDADWFAFTASANHFVTISCVADTHDVGSYCSNDVGDWGSALSPRLDIIDADGATILATSRSNAPDVSTISIVDGLPLMAVSFVAPAEGTYFVKVTSDADTFGADMTYALLRR